MSASEPLLDARGIVRQFPGVRALDGVDFSVAAGEVHALVGENGAGKTTLMAVLGGVEQPDAGRILLAGQEIKFPSARAAALAGIAVVHQELGLADDLSIAENILANRQPVSRWGLIERGALLATAREQLRRFEWDIDPRTLVRQLGPAERQVVEILKALAQEPRVLILDEPTSSLTAREKPALFRNVRALRQRGGACVYITHHLPEVFELADRVTVLRDGRLVDCLPVGGLSERDIVHRMVGRPISDLYGERVGNVGDVRLRVTGASRPGAFHDISFEVRAGEIVGFAGLAGAGRTELARSLFGADPLARGHIEVDGRTVHPRCPAEAIAHGIGYLSESRAEDGLFLDMPIRDNCAAVSLARFAGTLDLLDERKIDANADEARRRFGISTPDLRRHVRALSGGNQQKTLFAMWAGIAPKVLLADEPTRGVDVGARSDIYRHLRELASDGTAIVLISSDLPEVIGMSDRVLVMRSGRIAGEFDRSEAQEQAIVACAAGVA